MPDARDADTLFPLSQRDKFIILEGLKRLREMVSSGRISLTGAQFAEFEADINKLERLLR